MILCSYCMQILYYITNTNYFCKQTCCHHSNNGNIRFLILLIIKNNIWASCLDNKVGSDVEISQVICFLILNHPLCSVFIPSVWQVQNHTCYQWAIVTTWTCCILYSVWASFAHSPRFINLVPFITHPTLLGVLFLQDCNPVGFSH